MTQLTVENVSVARGDRTILRDVSFALHPGEWLYLQGPNGAGKTTLLEALAGLRAPASGRIEGADQPLHWIGHRNALHAALTPLENLAYWCELNGVATETIEPALERFGVHRQRYRPCRVLSAGQRRRVALSRLLLQARPLWLIDEPVAGLDTVGIGLFSELLGAHLAGGGLAIITSHQPFTGAPSARHTLALP